MKRYEGEVILVRDDIALDADLSELRKERILGFDTETKPSFRKGESNLPALVQLAGKDKVYVIQLKLLEQPERLTELFTDETIVKSGVALDQDLNQLQQLFPFEPAGFQELANVARRAGVENFGLRSMAAGFLGCRISKRARVSNWVKEKLDRRSAGEG